MASQTQSADEPSQEHERKAWHPVVWQQPPIKIEEAKTGADAPHKRIIRNIYRFYKDAQQNPEMRKKITEDMLLALPTASKSA